MKSSNPIVGSWDDGNGDQEETDDELQGISPAQNDLDDTPFDSFGSGPINRRRMQDMNNVNHIMTTMGWTDPLNADHVTLGPILFKQDVFKLGIAWWQEVETMKQAISDKKIANRLHPSKENNQDQSFN